jgi:hypothetical protein
MKDRGKIKKYFYWKGNRPLGPLSLQELVLWNRFLCDIWLLGAERRGQGTLEIRQVHKELISTLKDLMEILTPLDRKKGFGLRMKRRIYGKE